MHSVVSSEFDEKTGEPLVSSLPPFVRLPMIVEEQIARLGHDQDSFPAQFYLFRGDQIVSVVERPAEGPELDALVDEVVLLVLEHGADGMIEIHKSRGAEIPSELPQPDSAGRIMEPPNKTFVWRRCLHASAHSKGAEETESIIVFYERANDSSGVRVLEQFRRSGSDARFLGLAPILGIWAESIKLTETPESEDSNPDQ